MRNPLGKWALLALISSSVLVADQVTKFMAVEQLTYAFQAARARTLPEKVEAFLTQKDLLERGLSDGRSSTKFRNHRRKEKNILLARACGVCAIIPLITDY